MGAPEKFSRMIPKDKVGEAAQWELRPLAAGKSPSGARQLSARGNDAARQQSGYEAGKAQGYADAMKAAQQARAVDLQRFEALLGQLRSRFDELASHTADALLDLALDVAAQVLRREVQTQRDVVLPVVREALGHFAETHAHPTVRVSPTDFALVRDSLRADGVFQGCRVVSDAGVQPGGCKVETPQGEVDATLGTRWRRVVQSLGCDVPLPEIDVHPVADSASGKNGDDEPADGKAS